MARKRREECRIVSMNDPERGGLESSGTVVSAPTTESELGSEDWTNNKLGALEGTLVNRAPPSLFQGRGAAKNLKGDQKFAFGKNRRDKLSFYGVFHVPKIESEK